MNRLACLLVLASVALQGATVSLTLPQALEIASRQNPDVVLARLDQQRAEQGITVAKDPFRPKVYGGSGLAYTQGYPNSIDGNAPSIFQVKTEMALFNRPKTFDLASAKENARGAQYGAQARSDDVAYQTATLYLNARQAEHEIGTFATQIPGLQQAETAMTARVGEGAELPIETKRARINLADWQTRMESMRLDADYFEMMLAVALGYPASDRVKPLDKDLPVLKTPESGDDAAQIALSNNKELRRMQSNVIAKQLDLKSFHSARLPQVNLVAQYALFARYNYENYFQKFQRNNGQLGASITIPLLVGSQTGGLAAQALTDMQKLRTQMEQLRSRIQTDTQRSFDDFKKAQGILNMARMQLDLAREDLTVLLAQNGEGRVPLSRVEQARLEETNRWMGLYEAETQVERTQLAILRQMGTLQASLRGFAPPAREP